MTDSKNISTCFENLFSPLRDSELLEIYADYKRWITFGIIPNGGKLSALRDSYCKEYGAHGLPIMELDFLRSCAYRWANCRNSCIGGNHVE